MSEVIQQELECGAERIAVVSGPNLALEIAKEQPTAAVVSSAVLATASEIARTATNPYFRSFVNTDVIGTEFGGVLKNLIAVAIGIVDGVGYGENTKASIITRGLVEMTDFAVASGPNLALEIAKEMPTAAVVASDDLLTAQTIAATATNPYFRSFVNTDVIGTEFGGVLKNLIAVAIGIVDGVGYGENTKASIITRGLVEMTDFAVAFGALPETMSGLAGLGDLIATCESPLSRNNTAGRLLGQGYDYHEVIAQMNQTAEGLGSVAPILELASEKGVEMPIVSQVAEVLAGTLEPRDLAPHLTTDSREPQGE